MDYLYPVTEDRPLNVLRASAGSNRPVSGCLPGFPDVAVVSCMQLNASYMLNAISGRHHQGVSDASSLTWPRLQPHSGPITSTSTLSSEAIAELGLRG